MQLSTGIQKFWIALANYLVLGLMLFLYLLAGNGWKLTNLLSLPDLMGLTIVVALVLFPLLWFLGNIKTQMLQALPNERHFKAAVVTDYPQLDLFWLQEETKDLEALGFVQLMDYKVEPGNSFARSFAHPQHHCFAEIGQLFTDTKDKPEKYSYMYSSLTKNWDLTTINRQVHRLDATAYIGQHPKSVRKYHPEVYFDELLEQHLSLRRQMLNNLGISVITNISWSEYKSLGQQATISRKTIVRRKKLLLAMLEATLFEINPKSEWLGDYANVAATRCVTR
ncbi:hypothetical protein NOS3756_40220 [Nostoc sp. NIES-3756]|uniref:hypothetical protein n=1 Tax=Nostoc sp. NIES-3756 TaxID=1751286 RepID=UPI00072090BF|nr:hypothetical protein [Nostoc sp. NIES-3756]BAT55044.1 hypothetical protein NOS3756_40220 [Nostoc sp. NIES-3756]